MRDMSAFVVVSGLIALGGCGLAGVDEEGAPSSAQAKQALTDPCVGMPLQSAFDLTMPALSPTIYGTAQCRYYITEYDPFAGLVSNHVFGLEWADPWPRTRTQCLGASQTKPITMRVKVMTLPTLETPSVLLGEGSFPSRWDSDTQTCVLWNVAVARNGLDATQWLMQPFSADFPAAIGDPSSPGTVVIPSLVGMQGVIFAVSARTSAGTTQPIRASVLGRF